MTNYNYYYDNQPISKMQFLANVPVDWEKDVNELGEFTYGYYRAIER